MNAISNVDDINNDPEEHATADFVEDTPVETDAETASEDDAQLVEQSADEVQHVEPDVDEISADESDQEIGSESDTQEQENAIEDTAPPPEKIPKVAKKKKKAKSKPKKKKAEPVERIEEKVFSKINEIELPNIEMGALFAGVENVSKNAKKFDSQVTRFASGLFTKVTNYFKHSIESYKKQE